MAEIINLKRVKKLKQRAAKESEAEANRVKFGRTKAEKQRGASDSERDARTLDGKKLDP